MSGHVWVGNVAYTNSYVPAGKSVRVVTCQVCLDSGRTMTDDGSRGEPCDCAIGQGLADLRRCEAYCLDHQRSCNITGEHHESHGQLIHECSYGQFGHQFFASEATTA